MHNFDIVRSSLSAQSWLPSNHFGDSTVSLLESSTWSVFDWRFLLKKETIAMAGTLTWCNGFSLRPAIDAGPCGVSLRLFLPIYGHWRNDSRPGRFPIYLRETCLLIFHTVVHWILTNIFCSINSWWFSSWGCKCFAYLTFISIFACTSDINLCVVAKDFKSLTTKVMARLSVLRQRLSSEICSKSFCASAHHPIHNMAPLVSLCYVYSPPTAQNI